jgi:hypothetical protein
MKAFVLILLFLLLSRPTIVSAEYMLPYPSTMPGSKLYTLKKVMERLKEYWHIGSIAKAKYYMNLSDTYLVEAKTLFEYKQYLLATAALTRSDSAIKEIPAIISTGKSENKDMSRIRALIDEQQMVHKDVLTALRAKLPKEFIWSPERQASTTLSIDVLLTESIMLREDVASMVK